MNDQAERWLAAQEIALLEQIYTLESPSECELRATSSVGAPPSRYVTFFVLPANPSGNFDIDRRLDAEIETALADKGLVQTSFEEAQALIVVHTATPGRCSRDVFYQGWEDWAWRLPDTGLFGNSDGYTAGSVVVDMFDASTKKLVWHGFARHAVSTRSSNSGHAIKSAVTTMFAEFPSTVAARAPGPQLSTGPRSYLPGQ